MTIEREIWQEYVRLMRAAMDKAEEGMKEQLPDGGLDSLPQEMRAELVRIGYALATKYGEGAAAASCEIYDTVARLTGAMVPDAEPADTATFEEAAKAVNGTLKTGNAETVSGSVGRLVKMAGVDTVMKNALRDGAMWAWIPQGSETCAFCIMLASRGWQHASKNALRHGHAQHIHAHCDCLYAVRFDDSTDYAGYDPQRYLDMYYGDSIDEDIKEAIHDKYGMNSTGAHLNMMRRQIERNRKEKS